MKARLQKIARKLQVVHEKELDSFFNYDYIFVGLAVDSYILEDVKYYQSEEGANE